MLAIGLCVAGHFDGETYRAHNPDESDLYLELAPISESFDSEALAISNLDRERLIDKGEPPRRAMKRIGEWISEVSGEDRAVICAYPAAFDWPFFYWYQVNFAPKNSPVDFSSCIDMKTMFAVKAGVPLDEAGREHLPQELRSTREHTHNALDDAKEQAEIFSKLFVWDP